jgi:hypothetical protein
MHFIYVFLIFLLELISRFTDGNEDHISNNQTSPWSKIKSNKFCFENIKIFIFKVVI